jgi:hypothetical protein
MEGTCDRGAIADIGAFGYASGVLSCRARDSIDSELVRPLTGLSSLSALLLIDHCFVLSEPTDLPAHLRAYVGRQAGCPNAFDLGQFTKSAFRGRIRTQWRHQGQGH